MSLDLNTDNIYKLCWMNYTTGNTDSNSDNLHTEKYVNSLMEEKNVTARLLAEAREEKALLEGKLGPLLGYLKKELASVRNSIYLRKREPVIAELRQERDVLKHCFLLMRLADSHHGIDDLLCILAHERLL